MSGTKRVWDHKGKPFYILSCCDKEVGHYKCQCNHEVFNLKYITETCGCSHHRNLRRKEKIVNDFRAQVRQQFAKNLITRDQFLEYRRIQETGMTNMFDARAVSMLSGGELDRENLKHIRDFYAELTDIYEHE